MSLNAASPSSDPDVPDLIPTEIPPRFSWRLAFLRGLAAAHVVAGVTELASVTGNYLLQLQYMEGPMGLLGAITIHLVRLLNSLPTHSASPMVSWMNSNWIIRRAAISHDFFVVMVAAHLALGMLCLALGQGLWRLRPWARQLEIVLISLAGIVTAAHGVAIWVADPWKELGVVLVLLPILIVVPVLAFLLLPGTAVLFRDSTPDARVARRKRPWWMLSLQWIAGLLVLALALGILLVVSLGPMAEVALVAIHWAEGIPLW